MGEVTGGDSKPWVVILGGCGFIGRNLVDYLISNELVSGVRVVDKVPPQTAWLNDRHKELFENPLVEFKSANLINPAFCASALELDESGPATWDLVVNCAGETKSGQTDPVYREGILALSLNAARECARLRVRRYIEISSGYMYNSDKEPHKEDGPLEPWTFEGKWKSQVEEELKSLESELSYSILRPAIVYGVGDRRGLTPRLLVGGVYKQLGETMKLLWTAGLRMNTVHVTDVCRAAWHLASRGDTAGQCYNVVDAGDTTQGDVTALTAQIFNINHDYWGTAMSTLAKTDLASVVDEANDKHLCAWAAACSAEGIANTPLEPSARPDLLSNKQLRLDGSKLAATGFHCLVERPTLDNLKEIIEDYVEMKLFPKSLLL